MHLEFHGSGATRAVAVNAEGAAEPGPGAARSSWGRLPRIPGAAGTLREEQCGEPGPQGGTAGAFRGAGYFPGKMSTQALFPSISSVLRETTGAF